MSASIRRGDTLAERYRLDDLLSESGSGRFWRAHDRILQRHVALHVMAADDERTPVLLEAARRSATVIHPRILRVLDAQVRGDVCFVVNEWGYGTSLDIALASNGPLVPRRAAWLVAEVAESIAVAHAQGVHHGRLVPENVLIDAAGQLRVIGLSVDAALHGLDPGDERGDVRDLAGLLHAGLTGRWAGDSSSAVAYAPLEAGRVLRPRQVRAGVPRPLDDLVDELLNPDTARMRGQRDLAHASAVAAYLADFVGDPAGIAESLAAANPTRAPEPVVLEQVPDALLLTPSPAPVAAPAPAAPAVVAPPAPPAPAPEPSPEPEPEPEPVEQPEPDLAPFERGDTAARIPAVATTEPEPAPEPTPAPQLARALFAPDDDQPARRSRLQPAPEDDRPWDRQTTEPSGPAEPTEAATIDEAGAPRAGRPRWLTVAALVALVAVVVLVVALVRGGSDDGSQAAGGVPASAPTTDGPPISGVTAAVLDPSGNSGGTAEDVAAAVDGDPSTSWSTGTFTEQFSPTGTRAGLGILLDTGTVQPIRQVDLRLVGAPSHVVLYVVDDVPQGVSTLRPVADLDVGETRSIGLPAGTSGRYVVVFLTSLPAAGANFAGGVSEVVLRS